MSSDIQLHHGNGDPWDILPGESSRAFEAFTAFLLLGPIRTRKAAADSLGVGSTSLREWHARYAWDDRCRAYDIEKQRVLRVEIEAETMAMRKRHAGIAVFMQKKVAEGMAQVDPAAMTPKDLAYWLDLASKLERISRGAEVTKVELTGRDGGPIELAEALGAEDRMALMAKVQEELARRLGNTSAADALEGVFDAEIVDG